MRLRTKPAVGFNFVKLALPVLVLHAAVAVAQTRPDAGSILQESTRPTMPPSPGGRVPVEPPPPVPMPAGANIKVTVTQFQISGNTVVGDAEIQAALAGFRGKELDMAGLTDALDAIKDIYVKRGYFLAIPYLPQQALTGGVVRVHIMEGRLGKVNLKVAPDSRLRARVAEAHMAVLKSGEVVSEDSVYRQLLLLEDIPGVDVKSTMGPGANVGESDLTVDVKNSGGRFAGGVEVDNFGNKFAGASRVSGQVSVFSPTGFGDLLTFRGLVSQNELTQVGTLSYVAPVGPWGTKIGGSYTELRYRLRGQTVINDSALPANLGLLKASGTGDISTLLLLHPVIRSTNLNLFAQASTEVKNTEDRVLTGVGGTTFNVQQRRVKAARLSIVGNVRDGFFGNGLNAFSLGLTSGKALALTPNAITADENFANSAAASDRIGSFSKVNADIQRTQRITDNAYGVLRFSGQWANRNLTSMEKVSIGGPVGVRAYPVGEGLADANALVSAELRYTVPGFRIAGADLTVAAFFDGARIRRSINQPPADTATTGFSLPPGTLLANQRTFMGGGLGVRLGGGARYSLSADFAWRIGNERSQSDVDRSPTVWVRGTFNF